MDSCHRRRAAPDVAAPAAPAARGDPGGRIAGAVYRECHSDHGAGPGDALPGARAQAGGDGPGIRHDRKGIAGRRGRRDRSDPQGESYPRVPFREEREALLPCRPARDPHHGVCQSRGGRPVWDRTRPRQASPGTGRLPHCAKGPDRDVFPAGRREAGASPSGA